MFQPGSSQTTELSCQVMHQIEAQRKGTDARIQEGTGTGLDFRSSPVSLVVLSQWEGHFLLVQKDTFLPTLGATGFQLWSSSLLLLHLLPILVYLQFGVPSLSHLLILSLSYLSSNVSVHTSHNRRNEGNVWSYYRWLLKHSFYWGMRKHMKCFKISLEWLTLKILEIDA